MAEFTPHTGGCRCGVVKFQAAGEPSFVGYCHCSDCRRASGAPVSAWVGFAMNQVSISGETLRDYENGPVTRSFCGVCGSPIAYVDERLAGHIYFTLGSFDMPAYFKPDHHSHVREQLPYVHMPDGLTRHIKTSVPRPDGTNS